MYFPTGIANALTPTSCFYSLYCHTPLNQSQRDSPSRFVFSFRLDSGASISVLNLPIAKRLNITRVETRQKH